MAEDEFRNVLGTVVSVENKEMPATESLTVSSTTTNNSDPAKPLASQNEPQKGEPLSASGRKALITTVIAIALNPISLVGGYYINHVLQAPKLEIKNAIPTYTKESKRLGPDGVHALADSPRLASTLRSVLSQKSPGSDSSGPLCTAWLDNKDWDDRCTDLARDAFAAIQQQLKLDVDALGHNITLIDNWKKGSPLILEPVNTPDDQIMRLMQSVQGMQFEPRQSLGQINFYLESERHGLLALRQLTKAFDQMANAPDVVNGDLGFNVGILNSGDSDGVMFDSGTVTIDKLDLPINADNFNAIKAHSFQSVMFQVWYGDDPKRLKIKEQIKAQKSDLPFYLSIKTGGKNVEFSGSLPKSDN